jgi:hypothetical protein
MFVSVPQKAKKGVLRMKEYINAHGRRSVTKNSGMEGRWKNQFRQAAGRPFPAQPVAASRTRSA